MDEICVQGAAESRRKKIYDVLYRIEAKKGRRTHTSLVEYNCRIDQVRLNVEAKYRELCKRDR